MRKSGFGFLTSWNPVRRSTTSPSATAFKGPWTWQRSSGRSTKSCVGTTRDQFYEANYDAYAYARYLVYYLQEQGKLQEFYKKFLADTKDLTGATALEAVLGEDLETFEPKWRKWVLAIPYKN